MAKVEKRVVKTTEIRTDNFRGSTNGKHVRCRISPSSSDHASDETKIVIPISMVDELVDFLKTAKKEASNE